MKKSILDFIGNTPMYQFKNTLIYAKLENFNLTGSVKDRIAKQMLLDAVAENKISAGATIIEPTSGNTGIGLAAIGGAMGYHVIIVMPETMSEERRNIIKSYGAELVLTSGAEGMAGSIRKAQELYNEIPNAFLPLQFDNPSNPKAHFLTTGPEIWKDMEGKVDILVAGIGTGGTITGTGKYLKSLNPNLKIIGVEPSTSPILTRGYKGSHKIQGIGAGFVPSILDTGLLDKVIAVDDEDAINEAKHLIQKEGLFVGISSGAAFYAAKQMAKKYPDQRIVVIFPDSADRYLSTDLFKSHN